MALSTYSPAPLLFAKYNTNGYYWDVESKVQQDVRELNRKFLLETDEQDLLRHFEDKYKIDPLKLLLGDITQDADEAVNFDVSRNPNNFNLGLGPQYVPKPLVKYYIPFEGDPALFDFAPYYGNHPQGFVSGHTLCVPILATTGNIQDTHPEFEREKSRITSAVEALNEQLNDLGTKFSVSVMAMIRAQRKQFEEQQKQAEAPEKRSKYSYNPTEETCVADLNTPAS